jgi:hypothetical protein
MKKPVFVIIKVYTLWLLQIAFYYTPLKLYFMYVYVKSFYSDWMGLNYEQSQCR